MTGTPQSTRVSSWLTYYEDDVSCLESSTASQSAWLRSLYHGCLNKSVGNKLQMYSHIQALHSKKPVPLGEGNAACAWNMAATNVEEVDEEAMEESDNKALVDNQLSLVVLEDFSRPPRAAQETNTLLFKPNEFIEFLQSDNWGGKLSLRVVEGKLLQILLAALYTLEQEWHLSSTVLRSNLNSRLKNYAETKVLSFKLEEESSQSVEADRAVENLPKPYDPDDGYIYETLNVELVIYEKSEASNIPYIIKEGEQSSDRRQPSPMPRDILRKPYALKKHVVNSFHLPASEDVDTQRTIEKLEAELQALKNTTTEPYLGEAEKPKLPTGKRDTIQISDSTNYTSDIIEWIAEDPHLVRETVVKSESRVSDMAKASPGRLSKESQLNIISTTNVHVADTVTEEDETEITQQEPQHAQIVPTMASVSEIRSDAAYLRTEDSCDDVYVAVDSLSELLSIHEKPVLKKLNLTRNELYVTGLYCARNVNNVNFEERLAKCKGLRLKERSIKRKRIFQELQKKTPFDMHNRFKSVAAKRDAARKRSITPRIVEESTIPRLSRSAEFYSWNEYSKDQYDLEMNSALINGMEAGILRRLTAYILSQPVQQRKEGELETKSKSAKNKSKNNPGFTDKAKVSESLRSGKGQQISNNFNSSAKLQTQIKSTRSCISKLPIIQNGKEMQLSRKRLKNEPSVSLPSLMKLHGKLNFNPQSPIQGEDKTSPRMKNTNSNRILNDEKEHQSRINESKENIRRPTENIFRINNRKQAKALQPIKFPNINHMVSKNRRVDTNTNQNYSVSDENESGGLQRNEDDDAMKYLEEATENLSRDVLNISSETGTNDKANLKQGKIIGKQESCSAHISRLKQYSCECSCSECGDLAEAMEHDDEDSSKADYPPILGRLRRDFSFLKCKDYIPQKLETFQVNRFSRLSEISHKEICDVILTMIDTVMIRKEIVTSSLGYTDMTITFTKSDTSKR